jgi:hypothetical protein
MVAALPTRHSSRLRRLRERQWSAAGRAAVIALIAIVMGCLFILTYSLALGDPVPRGIDAALVGNPAAHPRTVDAVEEVARGKLDVSRYASVTSALDAIDEQRVYAALDLESTRPTLYVASAAGASVARVLERISAVDRTVRVVDTHPLGGVGGGAPRRVVGRRTPSRGGRNGGLSRHLAWHDHRRPRGATDAQRDDRPRNRRRAPSGCPARDGRVRPSGISRGSFRRSSRREPTDGDHVEIDARYEGHEQHGEASFHADPAERDC